MPAARSAAIVFAAAPLEPTPRLRARLSELVQPYVVAADRGAATALAFGYPPNVVIGDLDSIDPATLAELRRSGVPIDADQWGWQCGFYPGLDPGQHQDGTAKKFRRQRENVGKSCHQNCRVQRCAVSAA